MFLVTLDVITAMILQTRMLTATSELEIFNGNFRGRLERPEEKYVQRSCTKQNMCFELPLK